MGGWSKSGGLDLSCASGLGFDMDGASSQTLVVVPPTRGLNSIRVFHADHCANQMLTPVLGTWEEELSE